MALYNGFLLLYALIAVPQPSEVEDKIKLEKFAILSLDGL